MMKIWVVWEHNGISVTRMIQTEHVTKFVGGSPQKVCTLGAVVGECFGFIKVSMNACRHEQAWTHAQGMNACASHERMRKLSTRSIESIWASSSVSPWVVPITKTEKTNLKLKCPCSQSRSRVLGANYKHASTSIYQTSELLNAVLLWNFNSKWNSLLVRSLSTTLENLEIFNI